MQPSGWRRAFSMRDNTDSARDGAVDLDAYLERIGYSGSRAPTLETLRAIHERHPQAIPFENLDPFLGRPVQLDPASLERKLVREGRGGYCFEHNLLLAAALRALGYEVTGLAARVVWNAPPGAVRPRAHMLLRIDLEGETYLADVGFGGLVLTAPLRLAPAVEQATPHEPFRLVEDEGQLLLQALVRGEWQSLYRFDLQPQHQIDYEVANWYVSTHPQSHFVTGLMIARAAPGRRFALANRRLSIHRVGGTTEQREIATPAELRAILEEPFGIRLPRGDAGERSADEIDARLARLFGSA
jgi:N-hydroxyarylamine O-acetyltransferase